MKWVTSVVLSALVFCLPVHASNGDIGGATEKWARRIADDFLAAALEGDAAVAAGLLSPELHQSVERMFYIVADNYFLSYDKGSITQSEAAPDHSEYIYKGQLQGSELGGKVTAEITLRVAREAPGGKWSIRFVRIKKRETEDKHSR